MFRVRDFSSNEQYDIAKFLDFRVDVYDVISSPFLVGLSALPCVRYYTAENGDEDLDKTSQNFYGSPFLSFHIQYYNNMTSNYIKEGQTIRLFNLEDLNQLCNNLYVE